MERLTTCKSGLFAKATALYANSFPLHEQRKPDAQMKIMEHPEYWYNLIYDADKFVGILLCWETEGFIYMEHFCIFPEMRGKKYGQKTLELLSRRGKTVILKIDLPVDEISFRRRAFYERAGYKANPYEHTHPPYRENLSGHRLVVMPFPKQLSEPEYEEFNRYLKTWVMRS